VGAVTIDQLPPRDLVPGEAAPGEGGVLRPGIQGPSPYLPSASRFAASSSGLPRVSQWPTR
jgi:hypothetical protein